MEHLEEHHRRERHRLRLGGDPVSSSSHRMSQSVPIVMTMLTTTVPSQSKRSPAAASRSTPSAIFLLVHDCPASRGG
jgi:hypothetical protein